MATDRPANTDTLDNAVVFTEADAAVAWGKAYNLTQPAYLAPVLSDRICLTMNASSQTKDKSEYVRHFQNRIATLRQKGTVFYAEVGVTLRTPDWADEPRTCLVLMESGRFTTALLFEVDGSRITGIVERDMPASGTFMLSGVKPGFLPVGGLKPVEEPQA
jgi:hypothetical protein